MSTPSQTRSSASGAGAHVLEMQRRRLLLAFGELVQESGLESATVGTICKRAGVSRRTFYEQFEGREDCFVAAFDYAVETLATELIVARPTAGSWSELVRNGLTILLEAFDRNPGFAHMCLIESLRGDRRVSERRARAQEALASALDEGRRQSKAAASLPPLTAQGVVGGVCAVLHARLMEREHPTFVELVGPLTAMIVHPYLGAAASRRELERRPAAAPREIQSGVRDPFKDLPIRFTYRTARVLATIAENPDASNRAIADSSGITDEGQMSRLLRRLQGCELIENRGGGRLKGEPNAWALTERGDSIHRAISAQSLPQ